MNIQENKNDIIAVVPRVMAEYDNIPFETEIAEYLDDFQRDTCLTAVKRSGKLSVVFVRDFPCFCIVKRNHPEWFGVPRVIQQGLPESRWDH